MRCSASSSISREVAAAAAAGVVVVVSGSGSNIRPGPSLITCYCALIISSAAVADVLPFNN